MANQSPAPQQRTYRMPTSKELIKISRGGIRRHLQRLGLLAPPPGMSPLGKAGLGLAGAGAVGAGAYGAMNPDEISALYDQGREGLLDLIGGPAPNEAYGAIEAGALGARHNTPPALYQEPDFIGAVGDSYENSPTTQLGNDIGDWVAGKGEAPTTQLGNAIGDTVYGMHNRPQYSPTQRPHRSEPATKW